MNPTWAKGYARKGAALHGQRRYVEAIDAYELGLKIEDSPALRKGLDEVKAAKGACLARLCLFRLCISPRTLVYAILRLYSGGRARRWSRGNGHRKNVQRPGHVGKARLQSTYRQAPRRRELHAKSVCVVCRPMVPRTLESLSCSSSSYNKIPNWHRPCSAAIHA